MVLLISCELCYAQIETLLSSGWKNCRRVFIIKHTHLSNIQIIIYYIYSYSCFSSDHHRSIDMKAFGSFELYRNGFVRFLIIHKKFHKLAAAVSVNEIQTKSIRSQCCDAKNATKWFTIMCMIWPIIPNSSCNNNLRMAAGENSGSRHTDSAIYSLFYLFCPQWCERWILLISVVYTRISRVSLVCEWRKHRWMS